MKKLHSSPRTVRFWLFVLGIVQITALLAALERPAQAYVDPGSGFVFLQVIASMVAGAVYYTRHRLKQLLLSMRRPSPLASAPSNPAEAAESQQ